MESTRYRAFGNKSNSLFGQIQMKLQTKYREQMDNLMEYKRQIKKKNIEIIENLEILTV